MVACASRPRLYPNHKYEQVGKPAAEADVEACIAKADEFVDNEKARQVATGAGKGAVLGGVFGGLLSGGISGAVRGAAVGGAVGGTAGALSPKQIQHNFVNQCLAEKGYQVLGWD